MQLRFQEFDDFIVYDKAYGHRTHRVSDGQFGLIEYLSEKMDRPLYVVHRLDKETSGLILFAKSKTAATTFGEIFEKHLIQKTYYFLTDHAKTETTFTVKTHIEKKQNFLMNVPGLPPNSETDFEFVQNLGPYFLWRAKPKTGKPHQIRLHAEFAKINILGDGEHKGSPYFRLALHAQELKFNYGGQDYNFESTLPPILKENNLAGFDALLEENHYKRHQLYKMEPGESYRLIHLESDQIRADVFGDHLWIYDYTKNKMSDEEKKSIENFAKRKNLKLVIRHMLDRGQGVGGLEDATLESQVHMNWTALEEKVNYQLKLDSGFSPGLFLDQRENRKWVQTNSFKKKVLNLFSYTAGFSVNAALGSAQEICTVDVSEKFLNWSKENFNLNHLGDSQYEFFAQDAMVFLKGSIKRGRQWDLIICDPPSFARSQDGIWKLETDLPQLAYLMFQCLEPQGEILFTSNLESRTREEVAELFCKKLPEKKIEISRMPMQSLDFEITDDLTNLMKGFLVKKISDK